MNTEEFRLIGHRLIDWIADFRGGIEDLPVRSKAPPGWVRSSLDGPPPEQAERPDAVFADLDRVIVPGLSQFQHPGYFAFFPANASLASVLGDLASTGLGAVGLNWEAAPALTEVEELTCDWMRQLMGLGEAWRGTIQDTASGAALVAAICARERATKFGFERGGLSDGPPLAMYTSSQAHSSVEKAFLLAGVGRDHTRSVEVDVEYRMDPAALDQAMTEDREEGIIPSAVFVTVGTTGVAAIDPVADIVAVAKKHGAWVHIDAALAGSAMLLDECRHLWDGVEGADSLSVNPHKWIGTALDCSILYVQDPEHLVRVMSTNPSYLKTHRADDVTQLRDWGIPLGRRFRALKLWFHLRLDGAEAIRARLRRDLENARWLAEQIEAEEGWEFTAPPSLQTLCIRHIPKGTGGLGSDGQRDGGKVPVADTTSNTREDLPPNRAPLSGADLDAHTLAWSALLNESGSFYVTPTIIDGRWSGRVSIGAEPTERVHVEALWAAMREVVREVSRG